MYPPTDIPIDPLGLPPAPAAPALPTPAQPKSMNPVAKSVLVALAAMAGPGRGTGILQGLSLADQQAQARAQQQNALAVQDYTRQHQAFQDEQRTYQQQQTQRAAMLKNVLDSFQMELGNTTSDAEAENLYQSAGQLLSAQGFRGFDADSLKRKYHTPSAQERAAKAVNKFIGDKAAQQALENDPESLNNVMIDLGNGVMVPFASAREQAGLAPLKGKPKTAAPERDSRSLEVQAADALAAGDTAKYNALLRAAGAVAGARKVETPKAAATPDRPKQIFVLRNGAVTPIEEGTALPGDRPYNATDAKMTATADDVRTKRSTLATNALDAIGELESASGMRGIFGAPQLTSPGSWMRIVGMDPIAGSSAADAKVKLDRLLSLITLPELQNMRGLGAMSDREFATISKAATTLSTKMSDRAAAAELTRLKAAFKAMKEGQAGTPVGDIGAAGNGTVTVGGQTFGVQVVP